MDNSGTPNWDKVTSDNTFQVSTSGGEKNKIDRTFGVNLKIPNVNPRIVVQKQNESEDRLNDTTFAMYRVKEENDGKIYYLADDDSTEIFLEKDSDGDNKGEASVDGNGGYTYTVDEDSGVITVSEGGTEYKISPAKNAKGETLLDTTRYEKEIDEGGSVIFSYISNGQYYIREIKAPDGYSLNTNEIMAYSTPTANFINAGTADDGISVGRSPGPLIDSLSFMASKGDIDNTLSWIYSNLSISDVSDKFSDVTNDNYKNTWRYITEQYASDFTAHTTKNTVDINGSPDENGRVIIDDGRKAAYLVYQGASEGTIFNYVHNKGRDGSAAPLPYKNRAEMQKRLWTNIGWSYLEIYQDTNYGREYKKDNYEDTQINVGYTELEGENIRHLFANSVFVMVTDKGTGNLEVSKTVNGNGADKNKSFTFTVSLGDNSINGDYGEMTFTDGRAEFTLKDGESKTAEGLPERTSYTVKESDNRGYILTAVGAEGKIKANDTVKAEFTNTKTEHGGGNDEITVKKIWDDDDDKKEKRPDSVMVQLYCDGKAFGEEVELSEENNWMCKWENLDGQCEWTAKEVPVPDGYTSITRTEGNVITITNMLKSDKPDKPGKPLKPNEPDEPDAPREPDTPDTPIDTPDEPNIPTEPDEPIPDEPLDNTPRTGDTSLTSLYLTIMVASFIGMCAVVLTGRLTAKKEYKKRH